jgi:Flp pilus assembly protein TadD
VGKKIVRILAVLFGLALPFLMFYPGIEADLAEEEPILLAQAEEAPKATLASSSEVKLQSALRALDKGEAKKAAEVLESLRNTGSPAFKTRVRSHLAEAYLVLGDTLNAETFSSQAVKGDPKSSLAWNVRGRVLLHLHHMNESVEAFQKAVELDVKNYPARGNLAYVLLLREDFSRARYLLEEAVGIAETYSRKPLPHVFHNLGIAYQKEGEFKKAKDAYKSAAEGGESMSESMLAQVEECLQDPEKCVKLVEEFVQPAEPPLLSRPR